MQTLLSYCQSQLSMVAVVVADECFVREMCFTKLKRDMMAVKVVLLC